MNKQSFFEDHYLNIDVLLGKSRHTLKELKRLREGSIIEFDKLAGEPLDIIVDNEYFAIGEAVVIDENYGIRVTELLEDDQPVQTPIIAQQMQTVEEQQVSKPVSYIPSEKELEQSTSPEEIDQILSDVDKNEDNDFLPLSLSGKDDSSDEVKKLVEENNTLIKDEEFLASGVTQSRKTKGNEVLSQQEIDTLLSAISSGDDDADEYRSINSTRRIKIYDFKHPDNFCYFQIEALGDFMQRFCSIIPTIFDQQLSFKLESISQIPEYECYNKIKPSFIDQWKWYSSGNYIELGFDDFVINQISEMKKQGDFFSKEELSALSSKIGTPFMALLSEAVKNYSDDSDIPKMIHVYSAPTPDFLLATSYENADYSNSHEKKYTNKNSSMYVAIKIKVFSLNAKDSSGYITLNIPAEDLKKYIDINYYHYSHNEKEPDLDNIKITVDARLGETRKSISDIMDIGEGTIIELARLSGEPVDVRANGVTIARGDVIVIDENFGVRITEIL